MTGEENNYSLAMVIDRFEEKFAVLKGQSGEEILWPIKKLPDDVKTGEAVRLTLTQAKDETEEKEKLAKALLNEILKNDE